MNSMEIERERGITIKSNTITLLDRQANEPILGYQEARQVVFSSIYPMDTGEYQELAKALVLCQD